MSHTVLQAQVRSLNLAELNKQGWESPLAGWRGTHQQSQKDSLVIVPYVMESLHLEQNIYNTQSQHFLVKPKSNQ